MSDVQPAAVDNLDRHADIMDRLLSWATQDPNIRAIIQTGSSSRAPEASDRFSDRDIELICRDPAPLIASDAWIHALAPVWVALYLKNDPDDFETRLVFFEGARKVDFTLADLSRVISMQSVGRLDDLYERGFRVLLDKDGFTSSLPAPAGESPRKPLPSEVEFAATVNEFWFEAAHMPTYLTREELWVVKFRDWTMKQMLLQMLEWHALYVSGPETDVWHIGTKMKRWAAPEIWTALQDVFGQFNAEDSYRSLVETMRLFTRLTSEIASIAGFAVPASEGHIQHYVLSFAEKFGGDQYLGK